MRARERKELREEAEEGEEVGGGWRGIGCERMGVPQPQKLLGGWPIFISGVRLKLVTTRHVMVVKSSKMMTARSPKKKEIKKEKMEMT